MSSTLRPRPTSSAKQRQQPTNDHDTDEPTTAAVVVPPPPPAPQQSLSQRAISQTLTTTANLANLLPTGTLLAFQLLTPIFTNGGSCDAATRPLTLLLLALLAASCLLASFTDSVAVEEEAAAGEKKKKVYYGFATWKGMFLFDCPNPEGCGLTEEALGRYRIRFVDWVHAVLSGLVFVSVAMRDRNVVSCFYPVPGNEVKAVLGTVPVGIGVMCSLLFVVFPTRRHGIGYPVTTAAAAAVADTK